MESYWQVIWTQYKKSKIALIALILFTLFFLIGLYAPLLASSKPLIVRYNGTTYFPLLRYLFYQSYYTKPIDLFFNAAMFTLPLAVLFHVLFRKLRPFFWTLMAIVQCALFGWILTGPVKNPADNALLTKKRAEAAQNLIPYHEDPLLAPLKPQPSWSWEMGYYSDYAKLNLLLDYRNMRKQHHTLQKAAEKFENSSARQMPTLWNVWQRNYTDKKAQLSNLLAEQREKTVKAEKELPGLIEGYRPYSHSFIMAKHALKQAGTHHNHLAQILTQSAGYRQRLAQAKMQILHYEKAKADLNYLQDKRQWLEHESSKLWVVDAFLRPFHWEEDAGGAQEANKYVPWWQLTRINRKDLLGSLIFGIRVSLVVGTSAVFLSLLIGLPLGMSAGYFAKKTDLIICRIIEMWEAMPTFFMLLLIIAITQSKSIFLVISVLGIFGWTGFARFIRSEVLKQRKLSYVDACRALGFSHKRLMFSHILPNAIPPILTLLPFAMMAAITSESALSFLGLGEEGSSSWGVLMGEGRSVFPAESYLLWPPAILLTLLLICIALIGDRLRDAIDPKMRQ